MQMAGMNFKTRSGTQVFYENKYISQTTSGGAL
ncbi:hypothetical protein [Robinsoniella peoriensis]